MKRLITGFLLAGACTVLVFVGCLLFLPGLGVPKASLVDALIVLAACWVLSLAALIVTALLAKPDRQTLALDDTVRQTLDHIKHLKETAGKLAAEVEVLKKAIGKSKDNEKQIDYFLKISEMATDEAVRKAAADRVILLLASVPTGTEKIQTK